ncbi:MAG: UDP-N-acetylmuramoyl-L-alanyl-D-glutamate--2,6-diaminopimelate ligase [Armatimonadetes bacterium]|nr:UDP-N-acetylmuramoyl-L-alanyl-D-glutamate--2,6-diaminopimelate ligase [Armatimonadota bacterium]
MRFSKIRDYIMDAKVIIDGDAEITGITYDSRKVEPGFIFVAMQGGSFDGHKYISTALDAGAAAIVAERVVDDAVGRKAPYVIAPDGRKAMGEIAAPFYGFPTRKIKLIGVTGTSGKTTATHLIQGIFESAGMKAGLIGTVGAKIGSEVLDTKHTTPESVDLQRLLAYMVDRGVEVVAMEVSSHGLYQGRSIGCEFDCGVFTNIARDHLDFHKTLEAYLDAKTILFRDYPNMTAKPFCSVINADDPSAKSVQEAASGCIITFGIEKSADLTATDIEVTDRSVSFNINYKGQSVPVRIGIGGAFNVYNGLSAAASALALGLDLGTIAKGLGSAQGAPGRFESVECGQDFGVLVDYAHTPDELENVLATAKNLTSKRLIAVFGCGGDRDRGKRPIMGGIGADLADIAVVTSDNPRSEDPNAIIKDILEGILAENMSKVTVEPDRRSAIKKAIQMAKSGDLIVIAGKGHEDYQILADRTIHFDDREVAREVLGASRARIK